MAQTRLQLNWYNKDKVLVPVENGKYDYKWVSPSDISFCEVHPLQIENRITGVRKEKNNSVSYSENSSLPPTDDNLMILGESEQALKSLIRIPKLRNKYLGKIKLIYIDPPFNTDQTFTSYEDNLEHSIWLTMMRDRLLLLKQLLSEDGSIWVHVDTTENHRLRSVLDEVFGQNKFVAEIVWGKSDTSRNDAKQFSKDQDYIYVYSKNENWKLNRLPRPEQANLIYKSPDGDPVPWLAKPGHAPGADKHQGMVYGIQSPFTGEILYPPIGGCWRYGQEQIFNELSKYAPYKLVDLEDQEKRAEICGVEVNKVRSGVKSLVLKNSLEESKISAENISKGVLPDVFFTNGGRLIQVKGHIPDKGFIPRTIWNFKDVGSNRNSKAESKKLFPGKTPFATPKPERLLERILLIGTQPNDIVLDCFAGSGTTAAVAQKMGRKWVAIELLESTFDNYLTPRLKKVVNGQDQGGISQTKGQREISEDASLPDDVTVEDAATFNSVLRKIIQENPELKSNETVKQLQKMTKTKPSKKIVNWRGGGGFTVARLAPSCYEYNSYLDKIVLTRAAKGKLLKESVAANLGFELLDQNLSSAFDGKKGRTLLKVIEGSISTEMVDWLLSQSEDNQIIVIASTCVPDGVREYLRRKRKGSQIKAIPEDIFPKSVRGE